MNLFSYAPLAAAGKEPNSWESTLPESRRPQLDPYHPPLRTRIQTQQACHERQAYRSAYAKARIRAQKKGAKKPLFIKGIEKGFCAGGPSRPKLGENSDANFAGGTRLPARRAGAALNRRREWQSAKFERYSPDRHVQLFYLVHVFYSQVRNKGRMGCFTLADEAELLCLSIRSRLQSVQVHS